MQVVRLALITTLYSYSATNQLAEQLIRQLLYADAGVQIATFVILMLKHSWTTYVPSVLQMFLGRSRALKRDVNKKGTALFYFFLVLSSQFFYCFLSPHFFSFSFSFPF